jgi:LPS export ABC transporter protein LptC
MSLAKKILVFLMMTMGSVGLYSLYWFVTQKPIEIPPSTPASIELRETALTRLGSDGKKVWTFTAQRIYSTKEETEADGVRLVFMKEDQATLHVDAEHLVLDPDTDNLLLEGKVRAVSSEFVMQTENLQWTAETETLSTAASVRVEHPEMILAGTGFEYSPKTGMAKIKRDAHLVWK